MRLKHNSPLTLFFLVLVSSTCLLYTGTAENVYSVYIFQSEGGTTYPQPGQHSFFEYDWILITAFPNAGYSFSKWKVDGTNGTSNATLSMEIFSDHYIQPMFERVFYNLTRISDPGGSFTCVPDLSGYSYGTQVTVTSTPNIGFKFVNWILDGQDVTNEPLTLNMTSNHSIRAVFSPIIYTLTITVGTGGSIAGFNSSTYEYAYGTQVSLTASPSTGYTFNSWLLDGVNVTQNPILMTVTQNHIIQSVFQPLSLPTPTPSQTPNPTPAPTPLPTMTPNPSIPPSPSIAPTQTPTATSTPSPTSTMNPQPTPTLAPTPTPALTPQTSTNTTLTPKPSALVITPVPSETPTPQVTTQILEPAESSAVNIGIPAAAATAVVGFSLAILVFRRRKRPGFTVLS
jgi:hypothetical protein